MICPNCGNNITTQKICPKCGCEIVVDRINPVELEKNIKTFTMLRNIFIISAFISACGCLTYFGNFENKGILTGFFITMTLILTLFAIACAFMQSHFKKAYKIYTENSDKKSGNSQEIIYAKSFKEFVKLNYKKFH